MARTKTHNKYSRACEAIRNSKKQLREINASVFFACAVANLHNRIQVCMNDPPYKKGSDKSFTSYPSHDRFASRQPMCRCAFKQGRLPTTINF